MLKLISKLYRKKRKKSNLPDALQEQLGVHRELARHENKTADPAVLNVRVYWEGNQAFVTDGNDCFYFAWRGGELDSIEGSEFALWCFLPVAMAKGKDLFIHGSGTRKASENAQKLSEIWSYWMPSRYSMVRVRFAEERKPRCKEGLKDLMFFSGGVDSTYSLLMQDFSDAGLDLMTVQGMDYGVSDFAKFEKAAEKTNHVAGLYCQNRLFIVSNAYEVYQQYKVAPRLTYTFVLASCGFLFASRYQSVTLAADFALHQQFEASPYGSSFASDQYFDSGDFKIRTHGQDVTRAEKLPVIAGEPRALLALSFCKDRKYRPENCGRCIKCLRTKHMFLAAIGRIPEECFLDPGLVKGERLAFSSTQKNHHAHIKAAYALAFWRGNLDKIPEIVTEYKKIQGAK